MTLSLRGKLLATSLGVVLLMASLLGIVAFHTLKSRTMSAIQSEAVNYGHAYSVAIGDWMADRKNTVHALVNLIADNPQAELVPLAAELERVREVVQAAGLELWVEAPHLFRLHHTVDGSAPLYDQLDPRVGAAFADTTGYNSCAAGAEVFLAYHRARLEEVLGDAVANKVKDASDTFRSNAAEALDLIRGLFRKKTEA